MTRTRAPGRHAQRGVAAIEFAAVFMCLFTLLYGVATFGIAFHTQQALTRAAEDGARVVAQVPNPTLADIQAVVRESLDSPLRDAAGLTITATTAADPVVVTVSYPYAQNALLPPLPFASEWMPQTLRGQASAAKPT